MSDATSTRLFIGLILFWTFLTILSNVFANYMGNESIGTDITGIVTQQDTSTLRGWDKIINTVYNALDEFPVTKIFVPLVKIMTFAYSDTIPPLLSLFLDATLIFTYYVLASLFKGG